MKPDKPMRRRLPPLTAVRAFEAAARRLSFTRAADELFVTPGAISHHVRSLEAWLGLRLFQRTNGALGLTDAGQAYLTGISSGLNKIWEVTERLAVRHSGNTLTVIAPPSFANKWLIPRLDRYPGLTSKLDLRLSTYSMPIDFSQHVMDIGITIGWEVSAEYQRWPLLRYDLFPVCSPTLLNGGKPLRGPADLKQHVLIHDEGLRIHDRIDWRSYFEFAGLSGVDIASGLHFNRAADAYEAAIRGFGVTLAKSALIHTDLASGRLVKLFDLSMPSEFTYDVIGIEPTISSAKVLAFRNWLEEEAVREGAFAGSSRL